MIYQIRIAERIGPLMSVALDGMGVTRLPPCTRLTVVSREPLDVACLTRRLLELGPTIELVRMHGPVRTNNDAGNGEDNCVR